MGAAPPGRRRLHRQGRHGRRRRLRLRRHPPRPRRPRRPQREARRRRVRQPPPPDVPAGASCPDRPAAVQQHRPRLRPRHARRRHHRRRRHDEPRRHHRRRARRRPGLLRDRRGPFHHRGRLGLRLPARPARPVGHRRRQQLVGQPVPQFDPATRSTSRPRPWPTRRDRRVRRGQRGRPRASDPQPVSTPPWVISVAAGTVEHERATFSSNGLVLRQQPATPIGAGGPRPTSATASACTTPS